MTSIEAVTKEPVLNPQVVAKLLITRVYESRLQILMIEAGSSLVLPGGPRFIGESTYNVVQRLGSTIFRDSGYVYFDRAGEILNNEGHLGVPTIQELFLITGRDRDYTRDFTQGEWVDPTLLIGSVVPWEWGLITHGLNFFLMNPRARKHNRFSDYYQGLASRRGKEFSRYVTRILWSDDGPLSDRFVRDLRTFDPLIRISPGLFYQPIINAMIARSGYRS